MKKNYTNEYLTKRRWFLLILSCAINFCVGATNSWSVFVLPMEEHMRTAFGLTLAAGSLSVAYIVANAVAPVGMIPSGRINDITGPSRIVFIGGLLFGAGFFFSGYASSVAMMVITYGLCVGLGQAMIYCSNVNNTIKFFPDKRGLAGGLTTASAGLGNAVTPMIINAINQSAGVVSSFKICGIAFFIIICSCSLLLIKCPDDYKPDGYEPSAQNLKISADCSGREFTWQQMLKTPKFYMMITMMMCGAFSGIMFISQASGVAQSLVGVSVTAAAAAVSVLSIFNTASRALSGFLSDVLGRSTTLIYAYIALCIALLGLFMTKEGNIALFYGSTALLGLAYGAIIGIYPSFTADAFGSKNNSVNYGIMFSGFAAAGFVGPTIMKNIFISQGSYTMCFLVAGCFVCAGLIISLFYKRLLKKEKQAQIQ